MGKWNELCSYIKDLFGSELEAPQYVPERGEVVMGYMEQGSRLDLSSSGRGLQQTLLLLSYMYANPGAILLLDEPDAHLEILMWRKRGVENYLCHLEVLKAYAAHLEEEETVGPLFDGTLADQRIATMEESVKRILNAMEALEKGSPWDDDTKVSDDFLTPLFKDYFKRLGLYNIMDKKSFYELSRFITKDRIDPEVRE